MAAKKHSTARRVFLIGTGLIGGALAIGTTLAWRRVANAQTFKPKVKAGETAFNAWLKIAPDNTVIVQVPRQEMGQGIYTMLAMLVAEELDADWSKVRVEQAQINPVYGNVTALADSAPAAMQAAMTTTARVLGVQLTGGSTSTRDGWEPMRLAAASARNLLLAAAAVKWGVPATELSIEKSIITHSKSNKRAPLGEFAQAAAAMPVPPIAIPKAQKDWKLLGTSPPRLDVVEKARGTAQFGIDVRPDGLLYAAIKHIPFVSGTLQEVRWNGGAAPKEVLHQVRGENYLAVISTSYWSAQKALKEVTLVGGGPSGSVHSSAQLGAQYTEVLDGKAGALKPLHRTFGKHGDAERVIKAVPEKQRVEAEYSVPFLAHAPMEPLNCTAQIKDGNVDVWVGNQAPTAVLWLAAGNVGVPEENVTVHTPYLGGGFGRRVDLEVIRQALACAKVTGGKPVQLIWSREEDIKHDAYRPAVSARMSAALDDKGGVSAWHHRMVGPSVGKSVMGRMNPLAAGDFPPDKTNAEGAAELPYAFEHFKCDHAQVELPVPLGYWRSVGNSYTAFFVETFVDELAVALKKDPYLFRLELLKDQPRFAKVVDAAASAAQWSAVLPSSGKGWGRGIALAESFKSIVCQVVDVEVVGKAIHVRRVVTAVDCGIALHPDNVKAQIASAAIYGLTAALKGKITFNEGIVEQSNLHDYALLSMAECPAFETVIVNSGAALGGIGEVGLPPIAPALGNAIFAATGKRLRALPFVLS
ncbi:MAG: xanthine dehydrogenase family protein molybdopterin-binding subunit [Burkholderiales bacterium]|nr:xanthine dehydrogenase family protein molybdopterin-binding subunit [Burkholderiales bacterium]